MENLKELKARMDFKYFNKEILGREFPQFHYDIFYEWVKSGKPYACIELSRGFGKSFFYSDSYLSWRLFREKNFKVMQVSSTLAQSTNMSDQLGNTYDSNDLLKGLIPKTGDSNWSKQNKDFNNGNKLEVRTFGSAIRGGHYDLVDADDILRDAEYSNNQSKEIFWGIVYPTVQTRRGNLIFVGTPMSEDDLFHEIEDKIKEDKGFASKWFFKKMPAIITDDLGNWVESLWKERYSLNDLKDIESAIGKQRFAREYMLDPISFDSSFFRKDDIINSLSTNYKFEYDSIKGCVALGGSDFAISQESRADMSATFVVNLLEGKHEIDYGDRKETVDCPIIVRYAYMARGMTYGNQLDFQKRIYSQYKLTSLVIDKTNFGINFYNDLLGKINVDGQDFPVSKRNALLYNLKNILESGRLIIPYKDNELQTKYIIKELISQLKGFSLDPNSYSIQSRAKHDDLVIALALSLKKVSPNRVSNTGDSRIYTIEDVDKKDDDEDLGEPLIVTQDML